MENFYEKNLNGNNNDELKIFPSTNFHGEIDILPNTNDNHLLSNINKESNINNFALYKTSSKKRKFSLKREILGAIVFAAMIGTTIVAGNLNKRTKTFENRKAIVEYYGYDSKENQALMYLEDAKEFDEMDFDSVKYDRQAVDYSNHKLASPVYINSQIKNLKKLKENLDLNDLDKVEQYLALAAELKIQNVLLNEDIQKNIDVISEGYYNSLKKYAAELYDLSDYTKIELDRGFAPEGGGNIFYYIEYGRDFNKKKAHITDNKLKRGIDVLKELEKVKYTDDNLIDENINALVNQMGFEKQVDEKNLYNRKSEESLKKMY